MTTTTIDIKTMKRITDVIFAYFAEEGVDSVEIDTDCYWDLFAPELYDVASKPKMDLVGQVSFDYEALLSVLDSEVEFVPPMLHEYAAVMRFLGDHLSSADPSE